MPFSNRGVFKEHTDLGCHHKNLPRFLRVVDFLFQTTGWITLKWETSFPFLPLGNHNLFRFEN